MKKIVRLTSVFLASALTGCGGASSDQPATVPTSWIAPGPAGDDSATAEEKQALGQRFDRLLQAQGNALDATFGANANQPGATPLQLAYFMTDLSISAGGVLGPLILKGTPGVTLNWRKQYPGAKHGPPETEAGPSALAIDPSTADEDLKKELEPAVQALTRSGEVKDEDAFRKSLFNQAQVFRGIAQSLTSVPTHASDDWWVSRFRMDLIVDASGTVTPAVSVGGNARLRFEWHRLTRVATSPARELSRLSEKQDLDVVSLIRALIDDLRSVALSSSDAIARSGFQPYLFRVGVGFTAKGTIGIATAQGTALGQVYFSRNVAKPGVKPSPAPAALLASSSLQLADAAPIDRDAFRKGLKRATKIAVFFAEHAATAHVGQWKVYELRSSFDLQATGKLGLTELGGAASTEINFYNELF